MTNEYVVVQSQTRKVFEDAVTKMLNSGWSCVGGIAIAVKKEWEGIEVHREVIHYLQAMHRS